MRSVMVMVDSRFCSLGRVGSHPCRGSEGVRSAVGFEFEVHQPQPLQRISSQRCWPRCSRQARKRPKQTGDQNERTKRCSATFSPLQPPHGAPHFGHSLTSITSPAPDASTLPTTTCRSSTSPTVGRSVDSSCQCILPLLSRISSIVHSGGLAGAAIVCDIKRTVIHTPSDHSEAQ